MPRARTNMPHALITSTDPALSQAQSNGRSRVVLMSESNPCPLCKLQRVFDIDAKVADRAFGLRMTEQDLHRTQMSRRVVYNRCLRASERVNAVILGLKVDTDDRSRTSRAYCLVKSNSARSRCRCWSSQNRRARTYCRLEYALRFAHDPHSRGAFVKRWIYDECRSHIPRYRVTMQRTPGREISRFHLW